MVTINFRSFALPETIAGFFSSHKKEFEMLEPIAAKPDPCLEGVDSCPDPIRYQQMLERELDRQLLTQVEREDSEMLSRLRTALYEE